MKDILIVDDDKNMEDIYRHFFCDVTDKYTIDIVCDARIAYKRAMEKTYDLIILDIIMEPLDGEEFYACYKSEAEKIDQPILVCSVIDPTEIGYMKKYGRVGFLKKPIAKKQLLRKIDRILKGSS